MSGTRLTINEADLGGGAPTVVDVALRGPALLDGTTRVPITGELLLGSDPSCQIVIAQAGPRHARVTSTPEGAVVADLGSPSGTFVNGHAVPAGTRVRLNDGDAILVADRLVRFASAGGGPPTLAPVHPVQAGSVRARRTATTLGRAPDCDVILDHPTVSRHHAQIVSDGQRATLRDLGSAAGTSVNGVRLRQVDLEPGDQIAIGPFRIVYDGLELVGERPGAGLEVAARELSMTAGETTILEPTTLSFEPGELVAIIGESGAGKSTLLKALAGVTPASGGQALLGGEPVAQRLGDIGYVPQFDVVHDQLSVTEALDYAARLRLPQDTSREERADRVAQALRRLDLADRSELRVGRLSGGQRKRVAVATELLHVPGALFLDEPTTGLDPGLERRLTGVLRDLANQGQTVVYVTHATASIMRCDRVVVMGRGGYLCFDGPPEAVLDFFSVEDFGEVYDELDRADPREVQRRRAGLAALAAADESSVTPPAASGLPVPPPRRLRQTFAYQTTVLARRYLTLFARDRRHVRSLIVQVPVLAVLTALLFPSSVLDWPSGDGLAGKAAQLVFLMVMISAWLGSVNAAREIVKERFVIRREFAIGVRPAAYLCSKLLVLCAITAGQVVLFMLIVLALRPIETGGGSSGQLGICLILCSWLAVLVGLTASAFARTEDQASSWIPLLLVPQLLLSGAIVAVAEMGFTVKVLAALIPGRWGFAAAGHAIEMNARIDDDTVFAQGNKYGDAFFSLPPIAFLTIATLFAAALIAVLLRRLALADGPRALALEGG